jgi:energy-coupling factor transporter transmembrane protein EcfT
VLLAPLAVRDPRSVLLRLVPVGLAAVTVGWSALVFSSRGPFAAAAWPVAAREVLRICYLVVPGVLVVPSLPPSRLGDALAQRARLPHHLAVVASAALLRVQQLLDTWRQMVETRIIRALAPGRSFPRRVRYVASLTFALLVWTLRSSQQMAVSMDARGFATARRRTFALPSRWRRRDWLCVALAALLLTAPAVLTALL